uniref:Transmembrane protein n=1 Tax=Rhizophagus irregularis (strain DAOM 181602 / DAOM 197198 / MUCL 43194) TaxID=747089 RepID=U9UR56_RHIID
MRKNTKGNSQGRGKEKGRGRGRKTNVETIQPAEVEIQNQIQHESSPQEQDNLESHDEDRQDGYKSQENQGKNSNENNSEIEELEKGDDNNELETSRKRGRDDIDNLDLTPRAKKITNRRQDNYLVPMEFLEKINAQNKVLYKNQLRQEKKLDEIKNVLLKIHKEDNLTQNFLQKGIIGITKIIQKTTLYPTSDLFKEHLEAYIENSSKGYINNIGKHRWDAKFYSDFLPIASIIFYFNLIILLYYTIYGVPFERKVPKFRKIDFSNF